MITRNNYEEFFLLYVDNELSSADRQAVEQFVEEHPDLREEWELLLQCRVSPDETPVFTGKGQLLKQENPSLINSGPEDQLGPTNYESWFLSYIDGELDEPSRQAVVDFARQHPDKSIELQQLQQAVNTPDEAIVFPHKESLYRKEEKRKIAWLPFARMAAAALVLGAVGLLVFHPFRIIQPVATRPSTPAAVTDTPTSKLAEATPSTPAPAHVPANEKTIPVQPAIKKHLAAVTPRPADTLHQYAHHRAGDEVIEATDQVMVKTDPPAPEKTIASVKVQPADSDPAGKPDPSKRLALLDPKATDRTGKTPATTVVAGSFATQALLAHTVAYTTEESPEETASPKKNKLRGIFRKVTRALEKPSSRAEDDDRKVLIGAFQIALN